MQTVLNVENYLSLKIITLPLFEQCRAEYSHHPLLPLRHLNADEPAMTTRSMLCACDTCLEVVICGLEDL